MASDESARVVVLTGAGQSFCAGADLNRMRASLDWSREQNIADAEALAAMFEAAWTLPMPLIGRVNGAALGGGGLVACCDIAVAAASARFGFSEVKLGLIPAVIAQYVVPKIGVSQARAVRQRRALHRRAGLRDRPGPRGHERGWPGRDRYHPGGPHAVERAGGERRGQTPGRRGLVAGARRGATSSRRSLRRARARRARRGCGRSWRSASRVGLNSKSSANR